MFAAYRYSVRATAVDSRHVLPRAEAVEEEDQRRAAEDARRLALARVHGRPATAADRQHLVARRGRVRDVLVDEVADLGMSCVELTDRLSARPRNSRAPVAPGKSDAADSPPSSLSLLVQSSCHRCSRRRGPVSRPPAGAEAATSRRGSPRPEPPPVPSPASTRRCAAKSLDVSSMGSGPLRRSAGECGLPCGPSTC